MSHIQRRYYSVPLLLYFIRNDIKCFKTLGGSIPWIPSNSIHKYVYMFVFVKIERNYYLFTWNLIVTCRLISTNFTPRKMWAKMRNPCVIPGVLRKSNNPFSTYRYMLITRPLAEVVTPHFALMLRLIAVNWSGYQMDAGLWDPLMMRLNVAATTPLILLSSCVLST